MLELYCPGIVFSMDQDIRCHRLGQGAASRSPGLGSSDWISSITLARAGVFDIELASERLIAMRTPAGRDARE